MYIDSISNDEIILKSKADNTIEYIIRIFDEKYYLMGSIVYLLNPPNDRYLLEKR